MTINVPYKIRAVLYIVTALGTPIISVLTEQNYLPDWVMTLWSAEVTVVAALAAFNTAPTKGEKI